MTFVDDYTGIDWLALKGSDILVVPIQADHRLHRLENTISFIYIQNLNNGEEFLIGCTHNDLHQNGEEWIQNVEWPENTFCWSSNVLRQRGVKCYDVDLCYWLQYNTPIDVAESSEITVYHQWYRTASDINNIVPVVVFIPLCQMIVENFKKCLPNIDFDKTLQFYNDIVLDNYFKLENAGLPINSNVLEHFHNIKRDVLYTEYFPYTSTGRPSNRFGGINFAALNKSNGERSMITPTGDRMLIDFDYDSYHVKLVARLIGYKLPPGNLHHYFGRQYFNTPMISPKEYEESKGLTFRMLYGTIPHEYKHIRFFKHVHKFRERLWADFKRVGYVKVPMSSRKIYSKNFEDMSANKLFNYILQAYETEVNSLMLRHVLEYLYDKYSELILYTYDSFLFVYDRRDGKSFIDDIKTILNQFNMKVSLKMGRDYHNMVTPKKYKK